MRSANAAHWRRRQSDFEGPSRYDAYDYGVVLLDGAGAEITLAGRSKLAGEGDTLLRVAGEGDTLGAGAEITLAGRSKLAGEGDTLLRVADEGDTFGAGAEITLAGRSELASEGDTPLRVADDGDTFGAGAEIPLAETRGAVGLLARATRHCELLARATRLGLGRDHARWAK